MKSIAIFTIIAALSLSAIAQNRQSDKLFDDIALKQGITMLSFSKEMLDTVNLNFDNSESNKESNVTGDLHEVKLVIYNHEESEEPMAFKETVLSYLPLNKFDRFEDEDNDDDVDILIRRKGKKIQECHVLFQGEINGVLLSFFGDFKVDDVDEMVEKMDDYK